MEIRNKIKNLLNNKNFRNNQNYLVDYKKKKAYIDYGNSIKEKDNHSKRKNYFFYDVDTNLNFEKKLKIGEIGYIKYSKIISKVIYIQIIIYFIIILKSHHDFLYYDGGTELLTSISGIVNSEIFISNNLSFWDKFNKYWYLNLAYLFPIIYYFLNKLISKNKTKEYMIFKLDNSKKIFIYRCKKILEKYIIY